VGAAAGWLRMPSILPALARKFLFAGATPKFTTPRIKHDD
jgi:hypothetical protein